MAEHLPECRLFDPCTAPGPHQVEHGYCWKCLTHCICEALKKAEARGALHESLRWQAEREDDDLGDLFYDAVRTITLLVSQVGGEIVITTKTQMNTLETSILQKWTRHDGAIVYKVLDKPTDSA